MIKIIAVKCDGMLQYHVCRFPTAHNSYNFLFIHLFSEENNPRITFGKSEEGRTAIYYREDETLPQHPILSESSRQSHQSESEDEPDPYVSLASNEFPSIRSIDIWPEKDEFFRNFPVRTEFDFRGNIIVDKSDDDSDCDVVSNRGDASSSNAEEPQRSFQHQAVVEQQPSQ